jgi:hypothetical protein
VGLPPSPVEFSSHDHFYKLSCSRLLGACCCSCLLWLLIYLQFMWKVGLPPSPVEFSSHCHFYKLSRSWLLGVYRRSCLLWPACLLQFCEGFPLPPFSALRVPHPLSICLFCYCLLFSFSFFPGWGLVCPGVYADLAQGCLWEYHVPLSSPCGLCLPKQSGCWLVAAWEPSWFLFLM